MKLKFKINYHTTWGQELFVSGSSKELGKDNSTAALLMNYTRDGNWEVEVKIDTKKAAQLSYKYLIKNGSEENVHWEWGKARKIDLSKSTVDVVLEDAWRPDKDIENALLSQAFAGNLFKRVKPKRKKTVKGANCRIQLVAPRIGQNQSFCIVGSCKALGAWNPDKAMIMQDSNFPIWKADIQLDDELDFEYKYGIYDHKQKKLVEWELGENRFLVRNGENKDQLIIKTDLKFRYPIGLWKGAGVAIPVFSLRTKNSYGVGEFLDTKQLIDWAVKTGLKIVQILPINDTVATHTWTDSYPYAAISVFALHPIYLNLPAIGELKDKKEMMQFIKKGKELNALKEIDYEAVMNLKSPFYKKIYDQNKKQFLSDPGFKEFFETNKEWLVPYAAFSRLRDQYKTPDFTKWGEYAQFNKSKIEALTNPKNKDYDDYAVHYFIQYHLHLQMQEVADYAREKGVVLKGDIPIGIYRNSTDAWVEPNLYNMDKQAGAPPDAYAKSGQNWGFPTYNWEEMAKDGYSWWRKRLSKMAAYFDAYRIDHILGFFRIWEIPMDSVEGLMGRFNPAIPMFKYELSGLNFDYNRFCKPYIREYMLDELFGEDKEDVKNTYLNKEEDDFYYIKDEFDTQRKVEAYFVAKLEGSDDKDRLLKIKYGLFTLIGNVLLLEDPNSNGQGFHPKIALHFTYSFKELDEASKAALDKIYLHYYYERQEQFWSEKAMVKLPAIINATNMLVFGEDLGMVPDCVPGVMEELGLLNLEIQRMPKNPDNEFSHPSDSNYLSVVSPSCHDMSTIRGWWEEDSERTQQFYNKLLGHFGTAPLFCEPWISREMIIQHLHSPAMWAIFPIQDLVAMDEKLRYENPMEEQINVPSNPKHYWRYRFHMNMEDLLKARDFNKMLNDLVTLSRRDGVE
ncbi:MAG: 4-alpha-glucanotransferase [Cyclobacteriaceae bacterium]|nr:4-alpha-glucanotransferase [Cyclobacteriaceae bacterium]